MRKVKRERKFKIWKVLFYLVLIFLIVFFLKSLYQFVSGKLIISQVECRLNNELCPSFLESELKKIEKSSFFEVKPKLSRIFSSIYFSNGYYFQFIPPNKLAVFITAKKEIGCYKVNNKYFGIDDVGLILWKTEISQNNCLKINGDLNFEIGYKLDKKYLNLVLLKKLMDQSFIEGDYEIYRDFMQLVTKNNVKIIFPFGDDLEYYVGEVRLILTKIKGEPELSKIKEIDLRWAQPVLR